MNIAMKVLFGTLLVVGMATPGLLVWGWVRWLNRPNERARPILLSFAGFVFATASALLALSTIAYSYSIGGFPFYDPRLLKIFGVGLLLSVIAVALSSLGAVRSNFLRWHALWGSLGTLMFWIAAMAGE